MGAVYVLGALRTPLALKNGGFSRIPPERLGAAVLRALCAKFSLPPAEADGIFAGNAVGTGGNIARLMALTAGFPASVPACTVDMQCASGAAAISLAYAKIALGEGDAYLAGGMESASLQPLRIYDAKDERHALTPGGDGAYAVAQFSPGELAPDAMLRGAERTAREQGVTRERLDAWALESHRRALAARERGVLADVIVPVAGVAHDEGLRERMSARLLARMPLLFGPGTVTHAGNACMMHDGAAFALLVSERWLKGHPHLRPAARILGTATAGGDPERSPLGAMRTADVLLARQGLSYGDMAAIEFNEAFAVIDVLFERRCPALTERYNMFGGALAYGHPYGASGAVLLAHLLRALAERGGGKGILSIAGAGGMGEAILVEAV